MKKRRTKIVDFKNDVLFKFTLRDDQDPDCLYLLKLIIENIAGIECHSLKVQNPELNPQHVEDKDMILDIRVMNENGEIWVVIQKKQGAPSAKKNLEKVFGNVEIVKRDKGYYILTFFLYSQYHQNFYFPNISLNWIYILLNIFL